MRYDAILETKAERPTKSGDSGPRSAAESWQRHQKIADLVGQIRNARRARTTGATPTNKPR